MQQARPAMRIRSRKVDRFIDENHINSEAALKIRALSPILRALAILGNWHSWISPSSAWPASGQTYVVMILVYLLSLNCKHCDACSESKQGSLVRRLEVFVFKDLATF